MTSSNHSHPSPLSRLGITNAEFTAPPPLLPALPENPQLSELYCPHTQAENVAVGVCGCFACERHMTVTGDSLAPCVAFARPPKGRAAQGHGRKAVQTGSTRLQRARAGSDGVRCPLPVSVSPPGLELGLYVSTNHFF